MNEPELWNLSTRHFDSLYGVCTVQTPLKALSIARGPFAAVVGVLLQIIGGDVVMALHMVTQLDFRGYVRYPMYAYRQADHFAGVEVQAHA